MFSKNKETAKTTSIKSDKDQVKLIHKKAICKTVKSGFVVFDKSKDGKALHSGIARSELDAWKLANHASK